MSTLNIGVIGLGRMGQIYSKHVAQRIDHARLVAVCDVAGDVAATLAGQFTGPGSTNSKPATS